MFAIDSMILSSVVETSPSSSSSSSCTHRHNAVSIVAISSPANKTLRGAMKASSASMSIATYADNSPAAWTSDRKKESTKSP